MVTKTMREQPHTTPGTTTWTADFLTREGEGRKAMGDCLHDKSIPLKARRRLLQTNSGTFPCESRLQKWGKHSDGICGVCKRCREMGLGLLGWKPRSRHHRSPTKQRVQTSTELSVGRFLIEYFTPLTLGEQHQGALSRTKM
jgi:hypothetical protein